MLLGGHGAQRFVDSLAPFGMRLDVVSTEVGMAVAVKMCRSIVVKGLEALLFECVMGASNYGAEDRVFASLQESFPHGLALAIIWSPASLRNASREMEGGRNAAILRLDPVMTQATAQVQDWSARMDFKSHFGPGGPANYQEVLKIIASWKDA
jgi:3-hydroxyisobutyrate dehydrogenase-like beta-hydroxyacid dehydrogenase